MTTLLFTALESAPDMPSLRYPFLAPLLITLTVFIARIQADDDRCFESNGIKIRYVVQGEGEPVFLIHGFTSSIEQEWQRTNVLPELSKSYRVIALDNRGHGQSDKPLDLKKYGAEMAGDVVRLMDHLELKKVHVVGYSLGGLITQYLLVNYHERLHTATIGGMGRIRAGDPQIALVGALAATLDNGKEIGQFLKRLRPESELPGPLRVLMSNDSKALAACARGIPLLAITDEQLHANRIPTLAIVGGADLLKPSVDDLRKVLPNLEVVVIDGTDHEATLRSAKFVDGITGFLKAHPVATPIQPEVTTKGS